jgi:PAS domain S-box-containing protein
VSILPTPAAEFGSELRFQTLFEQAPFSVQLLSVDGRTLGVNQAWKDLWGAQDGDPLLEFVLDGYNVLTDPQLQEKGVTAHLLRAFGGEAVRLPATYYDPAELGKPGRARWVEATARPIKGAAGQVIEVMLIHEDVTVRLVAEQQLRASEMRLNALAELSDRFGSLDDGPQLQFAASEVLGLSLGVSRVGYGTIDPISETLHVERDWTASGVPSLAGGLHLREYGSFIDSLKRGEFISIADVRVDERTAAAAQALERKSARSFVNVPVLEQGQLVAVLFVNCAEPRQWTGPEHSIIRDVAERTRIATQRARAERALRESEARFRTIANAMPQMVWSTLADGYHDYYNQQWYDFTGMAPGSTDGEGWNGVFHPDDQPHAWTVWRHSLATGQTYEIEYRLRHRSGEYRWVLGRALPVRNEEGAIVRWMGTCTDIHEQKRTHEELLATNRRKDDFLAMLAHELRNPLAPITTAAHLLKATPIDATKVERSADIITRQVRHMTELVDDLLDVSRVTRGLAELERKPVELKSVVGNAIEQVRPLIEARGHQLTTRMASGDVYVLGDRTRLVQVVSNLLNNAAKYTPHNGALSLSIAAGAQAQVRVSDNGIGIDALLLPHVFDLFTQGERTPDRSQGGLGLGLALVKSLVELHGGEVAVESPGRGLGSAFTVMLPLLEMPAATESTVHHRVDTQPASVGKRVMVVDDNKDAADTLGMVLESLGHDVRVFHDPLQALETARKSYADVFILDIGLPGMDGYTLAEQLRTHPDGSKAKYIALTGYGSTRDKQRGSDAGFDHYLMKPADLDVLARLLDSRAA